MQFKGRWATDNPKVRIGYIVVDLFAYCILKRSQRLLIGELNVRLVRVIYIHGINIH